jgi:hypothetical protein
MLDDVMSDNEPVITGRKNKNRSVVAGMLEMVECCIGWIG